MFWETQFGTCLSEHFLTQTSVSCYLRPLDFLLLCTSKYKVSHVILSCILTKKFRWGHFSTEVHNLGKYCFTRVSGSIFLTIFVGFSLCKKCACSTLKIKSWPLKQTDKSWLWDRWSRQHCKILPRLLL